MQEHKSGVVENGINRDQIINLQDRKFLSAKTRIYEPPH
jgi:hypothetical protein